MSNEIKLLSSNLDELIAALNSPGNHDQITVYSEVDFFHSIRQLQEIKKEEFIWAPLINGPTIWKGQLWKIIVKDFHSNIVEYMTFDHRRCDELFAQAEIYWSKGNLGSAKEYLQAFDFGIRCHLAKEEDIIFPEFVKVTGMSGGPVQVMIMEHNQIRELLKQMTAAVFSNDLDTAFAIGDTMLILLQQHNMKEEGILYPMIKNNCDLNNDTIRSLQNFIIH
jgi:hemerythrin-like domain-containing protein